METYNYDAAAVPEGDADTTPAAAPETDAAAAGTSDTAQSGISSQPPVILTYPDSSSNDLQVENVRKHRKLIFPSTLLRDIRLYPFYR